MTKLHKYEAWIENRSMQTRIIEVEAASLMTAYARAKDECGEGEFCRGVNPIPEDN